MLAVYWPVIKQAIQQHRMKDLEKARPQRRVTYKLQILIPYATLTGPIPPTSLPLFLFLSLSLTHTHTHTLSLPLPLPPIQAQDTDKNQYTRKSVQSSSPISNLPRVLRMASSNSWPFPLAAKLEKSCHHVPEVRKEWEMSTFSAFSLALLTLFLLVFILNASTRQNFPAQICMW